uniref:Uncharacterized protein n=1 Tax=Lactuca sativa TaxID=4236 RepID=A0A9R1UTN9_LACSA|nr:hypothetical protein LSAT_V11C800403720 [Lactuca sativa]
MADLTHLFNNILHQLSNEDMVRVSLLYMLEQGFLGKCPRQLVTNECMTLVSNLQEFNRADWGFHLQIVYSVFDKTEDHLNPNAPRILIMETFPNSSIASSPIPGAIPRAVAYPRMRCLQTPNC